MFIPTHFTMRLARERDPEKFSRISLPPGVRREIPRVHIDDRCDDRGAGERQCDERASPPAEKYLPIGEDCTFGDRGFAVCRAHMAARALMVIPRQERFGWKPAGLRVQVSLDEPQLFI